MFKSSSVFLALDLASVQKHFVPCLQVSASVIALLFCVSRMQSRARAAAMIGAGSSPPTSDQIAWSSFGILILGLSVLRMFYNIDLYIVCSAL